MISEKMFEDKISALNIPENANLDEKVKIYSNNGLKLRAVVLVKEALNYKIKEAKEYVEDIDTDLLIRLKTLVQTDQKLKAVKICMVVKSLPLYKAKDFVNHNCY